MSLIEWKAEYAVGNTAVDHEHRELTTLINDLCTSIQAPGNQREVVRGLGEIYAQIAAHFALEEKIMRDARYPDLGPHKADHESLPDELSEVMDDVEARGRYDDRELSVTLERWFSEHFRTHDAALHRRL